MLIKFGTECKKKTVTRSSEFFGTIARQCRRPISESDNSQLSMGFLETAEFLRFLSLYQNIAFCQCGWSKKIRRSKVKPVVKGHSHGSP